LFCGTSDGSVRVYSLRGTGGLGTPVAELSLHAGAVVAMRQSPDGRLLFTAGRDGALFAIACGINVSFPEPDWRLYNTEVVLVSQEEVEERLAMAQEAGKQLEDLRSEQEYTLHRRAAAAAEEHKRLAEERDAALAAEHARFNELRKRHEEAVATSAAEAARREQQHIQVTQELENRYEHRLAVELDRYDRLAEEMELTRQRCRDALDAATAERDSDARNREATARRAEREARAAAARAAEERAHDVQAGAETLAQQQSEYESELRQVAGAAAADLAAEREASARLRAALQARKTREDQLRKKVQEVVRAANARELLYDLEKGRREKLEATVHHLEAHMHEREVTLAEKDRAIHDLRSNNSTLDNFRFVLDHRLQQLMAERGPIAAHVEGLEAHIRAMYDELVREFNDKKEAARAVEAKELKAQALSQEVNALRSLVRGKDRYISGFRRELALLVHVSSPKELEAAVKAAYKKF
ncbi:unnamed protein product, partial [Phaeothamnion confervicola]